MVKVTVYFSDGTTGTINVTWQTFQQRDHLGEAKGDFARKINDKFPKDVVGFSYEYWLEG